MKRPEISLTVMEPDFSDTSEPDDDVNVCGRKEAKRFQVKEACWPCRKAKRACAGERPCPRCKERNLDCQDVPHQMRGPRGRPKGSKALALASESAGMPGREMLAMDEMDGGAASRKRGASSPSNGSSRKRAKCTHGREKNKCKECGGSGICAHGREKYRCKECGGSGLSVPTREAAEDRV